MARTAVTVTRPGRNTLNGLGTIAAPLLSTALDQANGHVITINRGQKFALLFYNSKAGNVVMTIKKGVSPPAESAGLGDLVSGNLPTVGFTLISGLDSARFDQGDGTIFLDTDAGATGTLWAFEMPA